MTAEQTVLTAFIKHIRRLYTGDPKNHPDWSAFKAGHMAGATAGSANGQVQHDPRDWPEDFAHENGNYSCRCCECDKLFHGHKRRVVCKTCAQQDADKVDAQPANYPPEGADNPDYTLKGLIHKVEVAENPNQGAVPWFMCSLLRQSLPHLKRLDSMTGAQPDPAIAGDEISDAAIESLAYEYCDETGASGETPRFIGTQSIIRLCRDVLKRVQPSRSVDMTTRPVATCEIPEIGKSWQHHNGNIYTVVAIANGHTENHVKYPVTVVYCGENGRVWCRPVSRWHASMTLLGDAVKPHVKQPTPDGLWHWFGRPRG